VPTDLPDGWPYSVISGIAELRRGGPPPPQLTLTRPTPTSAP
jgi:hypothetical protein